MKIVFIFIIGLFSFLLVACGFHLRGYHSPLLIETPLVIINQTSDFDLWRVLSTQLARQSHQVIEASALKLTRPPSKIRDVNQLLLTTSRMQQTLISVSSNTQIRQYRLSYQILITLNPAHTPHHFSQPFSAERVVTINSQQRLGSDDAISSSIQAMRQQLASAVMDYLSTHLGNTTGANYPDVMGGIKKKI